MTETVASRPDRRLFILAAIWGVGLMGWLIYDNLIAIPKFEGAVISAGELIRSDNYLDRTITVYGYVSRTGNSLSIASDPVGPGIVAVILPGIHSPAHVRVGGKIVVRGLLQKSKEAGEPLRLQDATIVATKW